MVYRFGDFTLDEAARELAQRGEPVALQPLVFDLLAYLVRHAGRVVPKDELMDALWPDVHVTEASLQRAVSLARRALAVGGMEGAIRSYVRLGYRFAIDAPSLPVSQTAARAIGSTLSEARDKAEARCWSEAAEAFQRAARDAALAGDDLDLWAYCLECAGRMTDAAQTLAHAVEAHVAAGRPACGARSAAVIAKVHLERASIAVARAWIERAAVLLPDGSACEARVLVPWIRSRLAAVEGAPEEALALATEAFRAAGTCGNEGLKALCLAFMGFYNVALGRVETGAEQQDLAAAIALSSRTDAVTGALVYCNILWTCRNLADWSRARQWSAGFETWCRASFSGTLGACDLHRAEVAGAQQDLRTALATVDAALAKLDTEEPWALGEGHRIRGDIHAMMGDSDAARADYARAHAAGWDAEPGNAVLLAGQGEVDAALAALDRSLASTTWYHLQRAPWIRAHRAWIAARNGREAEARAGIEGLGVEIGRAAGAAVPSLQALVAEAQAHLLAPADPGHLRLLLLARQLWTAAGFTFHEARLRLEIASRLSDAGDAHGAAAERAAAGALARRIGAPGLDPVTAGAPVATPEPGGGAGHPDSASRRDPAEATH